MDDPRQSCCDLGMAEEAVLPFEPEIAHLSLVHPACGVGHHTLGDIVPGCFAHIGEALLAQLKCLDIVGRRKSTRSQRSEERRVGKECVSTCRSRWSQYTYKKKTSQNTEEYRKHKQ